MKHNPIGTFPTSFIWRLRYIEWLFIAVHLIMAVTADGDRLLFIFGVYALFVVFSGQLPLDRPIQYRWLYILSAIAAIIGAGFLGVSLDLLLYLYIAKSFFLLGGRRTIYLTAIAGIGWIASEYFSEVQELRRLSVQFEPPYGFGNYNLATILIFSSGLYVAVSIFTIFFCSTIVSEYKSRQKAEALAEQVETLAKNLERTRIARDIHDSLGHTLTDLDVQLKVAQKLRDRDLQGAFQAIDTAAVLSTQCITDVSHAIQTMRVSDFDLDRALNNLIAAKSDRATQVRWEIDLPPLNLSTSHQIYCLVKEGLINIQKHARASQVWFQAYSAGDRIILELKDNGVGFDPHVVNSGFGLQGMKERVRILQGKLNIDSTLGGGTQILITFPR